MKQTALLASLFLVACGGAATPAAHSVADAERMRTTFNGKDTAALAPAPFASANQELEAAKKAQSEGDDQGADLHAERALAYYNQAIVVARLARATKEGASADEALAKANAEAQQLATQRKAIDREVDDTEKKLRVAREAQLPPSSGSADPDRERARLVAAQSLVMQAHLLCGAARLVYPQAPGLAEADASVSVLEKDQAKSAPIDPAARARAACLASLTKARRTADQGEGATDTLLAELSTSGKSDLAPARDERGVVVTLRSAFTGEKLTSASESSLTDLGRVAAAHPTFAVQVVFHDASPPSAVEAKTNEKHAESTVAALVAGGAPAAKIKVEQAGARSPIVDPKDARHRDRNARVEIVFVGS